MKHPIIAASAFAATALCSLALSAESWLWKGPKDGQWAVAGNWVAPAGAQTSYPNGADADVYFPDLQNNAMVVYIEDGANNGIEVTVRSLTFTNYMAATAASHNGVRAAPTFGRYGRGTLHVGAGGVRGVGATSAKPIPIFNCNVALDASQTWTFDIDVTNSKYNDSQISLQFNYKVSCSDGVVWEVRNCAPGIDFGWNCDASDFYGTLKTNSRIAYYRKADPAKSFGNATKIIQLNDAAWGPGDGYGGNLTSSRMGLNACYTDDASALTEPIPFNYEFDFTHTAAAEKWSAPLPHIIFPHKSNNAAADYHTLGYTTTVSRALSGHFASVLGIGAGSNNARYGGIADNNGSPYFPERQYTVFTGDNSGLVCDSATGYLLLENIIAVAGHANAFGKDNAIPMKTQFNNTYATFQGVLAKDGITVNAPISRSSGTDYYLICGAADPDSTCTFKGAITASTTNPLRLTAPKGAKARFEGSISGTFTTEKCLEVFGEGDVELAAENKVSGKLLVRAGRRTLDLSTADQAVLDASGLSYVKLLQAPGVGKATVRKAAAGKWSFAVYENSVVATKAGTVMFVR